MIRKSKVAEELSKVLANSYLLYTKTQNFHWNVEGTDFYALHGMFEAQYKELADAIDETAERIRALGVKAPGSLGEFLAKSSLKEEKGHPKAAGMIQQLIDDHETLAQSAKQALDLAQAEGDDVTVDMMVERIQAHNKTAWMLRSSL